MGALRPLLGADTKSVVCILNNGAHDSACASEFKETLKGSMHARISRSWFQCHYSEAL